MSGSLRLTRRALLVASGLGALAGCGAETVERPARTDAPAEGSRRVRYGEDPSQFADLRLPDGEPLGTVVLLHGGSWVAPYGVEQIELLAERLTVEGYATWNVEYRRVGAGGGVPETLLDVAAAVDRLAGPDLPDGIAKDVVLIGHSAGGHLSVWAASRTAETPGGEPRVKARGAISLAGVLDLTRGSDDPQLGRIVTGFVGGRPTDVPERYASADPTRLVPAPCPVWAVHADRDELVPLAQSSAYVDAARAVGGVAEQVVVPADHLSVVDPDAVAFPTILKLIEGAALSR